MTTSTDTNKAPRAYEIVNDKVLQLLEQGVCPWRPGFSTGWTVARNHHSGKKYRGTNWFILNSIGGGRWMTFNQVKEHGGNILKGSKGMPVVFFGQHTPKGNDEQAGDSVEQQGKSYRFLKYYTVFHETQIEGIEFPPLAELVTHDHDPIELAQELVEKIKHRAAPFLHRDGLRYPCYIPAMHVIQMPPLQRWENAAEYYVTLFHEMIHSTKKALGRPQAAAFGDQVYGEEELTAEMGACYLAAECGIWHNTQQRNAAYLDGWMKAIKADPKLLVVSASRAQRAVDYLLGEIEGRSPAETQETAGVVQGSFL